MPDTLDSLPAYLLRNSVNFADRVAMRHKDLGIWREWSWADVTNEVRRFSIGFAALGLKRGDKVAIVGANRPRLYWAFSAIQACEAVPVPVYADSVAEEMQFVLEHAGASYAVCQDQEQVDKILSIQDQLPDLKAVLYDEPRGMRDYDPDQVIAITRVQELGDEVIKRDTNIVQRWADAISQLKLDDMCAILYTSGTTGRPKGVMLSSRNLIQTSVNANAFDNLDHTEETIAYLPLAWVGDHVFSYTQSLVAGYSVCCPESPDTVTVNRREIAPTYFFAPPRVFESLLTTIMVSMEDASAVKRWMFRYFIRAANKSGERILNKEFVNPFSRLNYKLGEWFVYGPLKNRLGMNKIRVAYTAGEAIGPDIFRFYRALGINLKQLYGQTEASVYITAQPDGQINANTVGTPSPEVELRIEDSGEVMYRSPGVFMGYYKNDLATAETKTRDGWVYTGDAGYIDDAGHLRIIDRANDVGKLNDGSMFPPKYIENKLKFFPNIKEAVAFGDGRDFVSAFINIDLVAVANWAERNNIVYGSYQELAGHPEVYQQIEEQVRQVNRDLADEPHMAGAQIHRFLVLHKELDADDGELTRTLKVRRKFVNERYDVLIEALYSDKTEQFVSTEVVFEDGRTGNIDATVRLTSVSVENVDQKLKVAS